MLSIGRFCSIFTLAVLLCFMLGCDNDGDQGMVEPLSDEPIIVESVLCLDVDDARPVEITDTFFESDDRIYLWIYWSNVDLSSEVKVSWYEPGTELAVQEDSQSIDSLGGYAITWFSIDKPIGGFEPGDWLVDIYMDGLFERSHLFSVLED